jgi:hypothetical protein
LKHVERIAGFASLLLEGSLPTSAADIEFSLTQVLDLIAPELMKGA